MFESEGNLPFHRDAVYCDSIPMLVYECFCQAQDVLPALKNIKINKEILISALIKDAYSSPQWRFDKILEATEHLAKKNELLEYYHTKCKNGNRSNPDRASGFGMRPGYNFFHNHIIINGHTIGMNNIYDAAIITGVVLNASIFGLNLSKINALISNMKYVLNGIKSYFSVNH